MIRSKQCPKVKFTIPGFKLITCLILLSSTVIGQNTATVESAFEHLLKYPNVRDCTMNSAGDEAFVSIQSPLGEFSVIAQMNKISDVWSEPEIVNFSGVFMDLEPFISMDDLRLYFASNRPLDQLKSESKDFDIWYVERETKDSKWGNPVNLGGSVNTEGNEFYPSVSRNGNLYFTGEGPDSKGKDDIFFSAWNGNEYSVPVSLGTAINSEGYEYNAYISSDESFMIFGGYNREDGMGSGDLYISFRNDDLEWGEAANLGKNVNSKQMDYCPFVDMSNFTLYFTSKRSTISAINDFNDMEDVLKELNISENGMSRIYKVPFEKEMSRLKSK